MLSIARLVDIAYYLKKTRRRRRGADEPDLPDGTPMDDDPDANYYSSLCDGGVWWGSGTPLLGLVGHVKPKPLEALSNGFSPDGRPLVQNAGAKNRCKGWDLTFSVPKSLSVVWTQVDHETRLRISQLIRQATIVALTLLSNVAVLTRRGKGGKIIEPAMPIFAIFADPTSREFDPQLHEHCVLFNVAGRADGTFGTILAKPFFFWKLTAGAVFRAELAHLLMSELGLQLEQDKHGFRVVGVPQKLVDHYSTRSKQIRAILRSNGYHSAKAAAVAALLTRKFEPESPPSLAELLELWQKTNKTFGFTNARAQRLIGRISSPQDPPVLKSRIVQAIQDLVEIESYFSEQQLIRQVATTVVSEGIAAAQIIDQVRSHLLESPDLVPLGIVNREPLFTTKEVLELEKEIQATINKGKYDASHVIQEAIVERFLDEYIPLGSHLTEDEQIRNREQRAAVLKLLTYPGNFKVLEGMAGTGKTYVLSVVRRILEKLGFRMIGLAPSAIAAANLQEGSGIESDTLAMRLIQLDSRRAFARHHKRQLKRLLQGQRTYAYRGAQLRLDNKTVLAFDESAMEGTQKFAKVLKLAVQAGAKVIAVGDRRQLQPIAAGGLFPLLADLTDKAELLHVVRQKIEPDDPNRMWHRDAGKLIAAGHIRKALKLFNERGRISLLKDREQALLSIVRDWSVPGINNPTDHIILAGLCEEVTEINVMCQTARTNAGVLGSQYIAVGDYHIRKGDVVLFRKNSRLHQVKNGDRGIVLGINRSIGTMAVRLHRSGKTVFIPYRSYTDIQLGYAMTTHLAQGSTVPSVYVLLGGSMQDRHLSYVQTTRACESTRLYVDECNAGPDLTILISQMKRLRPKLLALDIISANPPSKPSPTSAAPGTPVDAAAATTKKAGQKKVTRIAPKKRKHSATAPNKKSASRLQQADAQAPQQTAQPQRIVADQSRNAAPNKAPGGGNTSSTHIGQINDRVAKSIPGPGQQNRNASSGVTPIESAIPSQSDKQPAKIPESVAASATKVESTVPPNDRLSAMQALAAHPPRQTVQPDQNAENQTRDAIAIETPCTSLSTDISNNHRATKPDRIPVPSFRLKASPPPRDILDVSHVQVSGTTDVKLALAAVDRYGRLPGGIVVEGDAKCDMPILSLAIDPSRPTQFLINDSLVYDTGLSAEEVALLWHAVLEDGRAMNDFGVLSQITATGISDDTLVAVSMMQSDNALGGIIYGYDSQFRVANPAVPAYRNPFISELCRLGDPKAVDRHFVNYLQDLDPQIFLAIVDVHFAQKSEEVFRVNSTNVTAILTAVKDGIPIALNGSSIAATCFPEVHEAFQHFLKHFQEYARTEPHLARTIAYAEVVCLLRRAKAANAALVGQAHVLRLVAQRQQLPLPRFNYTLRTQEFAKVLADTARRLADSQSSSYDDLKSAVVGFAYARRAGHFTAYESCKRKALQAFSQLEEQHIRTKRQNKFFPQLVALVDRIQELSHDVLIGACIRAAFSSRTKQEKEGYLQEALSRCKWQAMITQDTTTRCNRLEVESYLDRTFDPIPALGRVRVDEPSSIQPYSVLTTINTRRRHSTDLHASPSAIQATIQGFKEALGFAKLAKQDVERWNTIEADRSTDSTLWLLDEIFRLDVAVSDYLSFGKDAADRPLDVLRQLAAKRLKELPATSFSTRLLHSDSPFFASQDLLRHETPGMLARLFASTQQKMAWHDPAFDVSGKTRVGKLFSKIRLSDPERWWREFRQTHALSPDNDASIPALLLAYEMKVRSVTVQQVHQAMRRHQTLNPQAALFFFDLEVSERARQNEIVRKTLKK